jgi:hypothetical protein
MWPFDIRRKKREQKKKKIVLIAIPAITLCALAAGLGLGLGCRPSSWHTVKSAKDADKWLKKYEKIHDEEHQWTDEEDPDMLSWLWDRDNYSGSDALCGYLFYAKYIFEQYKNEIAFTFEFKTISSEHFFVNYSIIMSNGLTGDGDFKFNYEYDFSDPNYVLWAGTQWARDGEGWMENRRFNETVNSYLSASIVYPSVSLGRCELNARDEIGRLSFNYVWIYLKDYPNITWPE